MSDRKTKTKEKQIKLAQSFNDGIEYKLLKHKNKDTTILTNIKSDREKQNEKHLEFLKIKNEYENSDSKEFPAWIFCENSVVDFYKFTDEELHKNILPLDKIDNRKSLLENSDDKGTYYFKIRDRLINKSELNMYIKSKDELLEYLFKLFRDLFTESHYNIFKSCKNILDENKKNKKKIYLVKNNLQILEDETGINISKFFSVNWNLPELYIPIKKSQLKKNKGIDYEFDLKIDKISDYNNKIIQEDKYIYQTLNKIQHRCISILTGNIQILSYKQNSDESYQKKWSELSQEQRLDRIKDYCNHFIINKIYLKSIKSNLETIKEQNNITTTLNFENENILIDKLYNLLSDRYTNNILKYKQIKWNVKQGIIESIHNVILDLELKDDHIIFIKVNFKEDTKSIIKKKISSSKSLTNLKSNIENINEVLIKFIVDSIKKYSGDDYSVLKEKLLDNCLEKIKDKLKVNKLTISDKEFIVNQYNIFFDEIIQEIN